MNKVVFSWVFLSLFSCSFAIAEENKIDCENSRTEIDMNYCAGERFKKADKELNDLYKKQMDHLTMEDTRKRLREAQRAWILFRDKSCDYEAMPSYPGTSYSRNDTECRVIFTKQRIEDLKRYVACEENGCPY